MSCTPLLTSAHPPSVSSSTLRVFSSVSTSFRLFRTETAFCNSLLSSSTTKEGFSLKRDRSCSSLPVNASLSARSLRFFPSIVAHPFWWSQPNPMAKNSFSKAASLTTSSTRPSPPNLINELIRRRSGNPLSAWCLPSAFSVTIVCICSWSFANFFARRDREARMTAAWTNPLTCTTWSTRALPPSFSSASRVLRSFARRLTTVSSCKIDQS